MNKNPKILIVDDNKENLKVVGNFLKEKKYNIAFATGGKQAISATYETDFDLILLDIMMPEMDGYEVCSALKSRIETKEIPIIFLTALKSTDDMIKGFQLGGVDYITKPFVKEELLTRIASHLDLYLSKKQLIEFSKNRDLIYSVISHDIKSPFNKIKQLVSLINSGFLDPNSEEFKELISILDKQNNDTLQLINDLIEWGTFLKNNGIEIKKNNLFPVIASSISFLKNNIEEKNLTVINHIPDDAFAKFETNSMEVVIRNLISNAIKYTNPNGQITIELVDLRNKIQISVKDSGIGMENTAIETILHKNHFFTTLGTNNEKGRGLGLQLVKDIIKMNNGTLHIESEVAKGSSFNIIINKY